MKKSTFALALISASSLSATVGFNCPRPQSLVCQVDVKKGNEFYCTSEAVKVRDGANVLGYLPFYGPHIDIVPGFDFEKAQWDLVLGEYSYGFPDCVYVNKDSGTQMNFIYRPEDLRKITSKESCQFSGDKKGPHVVCEAPQRAS